MVPLDTLTQQCRGGQSNAQGGAHATQAKQGGHKGQTPPCVGRRGRLSHPQLVHQIQNPISTAPQGYGNTIVSNQLN